jgi:spermidine/putrescine-binding protein
MEDPRAPVAVRLGLRVIYNLPELGPRFLGRLFGEMDVTLTRDRRQSVDWLAVGKYPLCMFCSDGRYAKAQGLPVDEFRTVEWLKQPAVAPGGTSTMALLNRAPHPNAATVFINWMLSRKGQTTLQDVLNPTGRIYESMREDIPKDIIPTERRRQKSVEYIMMATPTRSDNVPPAKLLKQIIR